MSECIQARRVGVSHLEVRMPIPFSENAVSQGESGRLAAGRQCPGADRLPAAPHPPVHLAVPVGRGALTFQTLLQQKGTFEVFIWGTKDSLYLDSGAAFKALIQTELYLLNSSALSIYMPEILVLS